MFQEISKAVIEGQAPLVEELIKKALNEGSSPGELIQNGLLTGMAVVGERFKKNEFYVPEVLIAARAMKRGLAILEPLLTEHGLEPVATLLIGTVQGDLHDIGKNLVAMMFEGAGFRVIDLGIDVKPAQFVETVETYKPEIVALSALLTTTMPAMMETIDSLMASGLREQVKVIVGGAPVTGNYASEIGADGYAPDASSAVDKAKELLGIDIAASYL